MLTRDKDVTQRFTRCAKSVGGAFGSDALPCWQLVGNCPSPGSAVYDGTHARRIHVRQLLVIEPLTDSSITNCRTQSTTELRRVV